MCIISGYYNLIFNHGHSEMTSSHMLCGIVITTTVQHPLSLLQCRATDKAIKLALLNGTQATSVQQEGLGNLILHFGPERGAQADKPAPWIQH